MDRIRMIVCNVLRGLAMAEVKVLAWGIYVLFEGMSVIELEDDLDESVERQVERPVTADTMKLDQDTQFLRLRSSLTYFPRPGWPRFWQLFGFCLPKKTREIVYEPGRNELLEDYQLTRRQYRTKWARRWLAFCFTFRTVLLIADCWRVLLGQGAMKVLLGFVPHSVRQWFTRQS